MKAGCSTSRCWSSGVATTQRRRPNGPTSFRAHSPTCGSNSLIGVGIFRRRSDRRLCSPNYARFSVEERCSPRLVALLTRVCYFHNNKNMETKTAVVALGALAQETRLAIFRLLVVAGPEGMAAGIIASRLNVPAPTLSFHLSQLSHAGLVRSVRRSRSILYTAEFDAMSRLLAFLTKDCCGGRPELCAPRPTAVAKPRRRRAALSAA